MPATPQFQPLESRRLLAAIVGSDVAWGRDGVVARNQYDVYVGRIARGFFTSDRFGTRDATVIRRYNDSGKLLASFTPVGLRYFSELAVDDNGRIVAAASLSPDNTTVEVRRYLSDGKPDATFGKNGVTTLAPVVDKLNSGPNGGADYVYAMTTALNGSVYLFHNIYRAGGRSDRLVTRLLPDGKPDPSFGTDGNVALPGAFDSLGTPFIKLDYANRIVTAVQADDQYLITRLRPDGTLDRSYGKNGTFAAALRVRATDNNDGVTLDGRGRVIVADTFIKSGRTVQGSRLLRVTDDGRLDDDFGGDGDAATTLTGNAFSINSIVVMPDYTISAQLGDRFWRLGDDGQPLRGRAPALARDTTSLIGLTRDGALLGRTFGKESVTRVVSLPPAAIGRTGRLYLYGDDSDDNFRLRRGSGDDELYVDHNGQRVGVFRSVIGVNADLRGGDNVLVDRYLASTRDLPMTVTSGNGRDSIYAGAGDDSIEAGGGNDTVYAGPGDDTVLGERDERQFGDDAYDLGPGNDTAGDVFGVSTVDGGAGDDMIQTGYANDRLYGGEGNDRLTAGEGNNVVYGDAGDDSITSRAGNDRLYGGRGDDTIDAGRGDDRVYGDGVGTPRVPTARNVLKGGAGADRVRRESDLDVLDGLEAELA